MCVCECTCVCVCVQHMHECFDIEICNKTERSTYKRSSECSLQVFLSLKLSTQCYPLPSIHLQQTGSVAGAKAANNPFQGLKITTDMLRQNLPDFDTHSVITSKSFKGMNLKKKEKQKLRHDLWVESEFAHKS